MAPKSKLEKVAWEWAEKTAPQDVTEEHKHRAYRLDLKPCALHLCRLVVVFIYIYGIYSRTTPQRNTNTQTHTHNTIMLNKNYIQQNRNIYEEHS